MTGQGPATDAWRQRRRGLLVLGSLAVVSVGLFVVAPLFLSAYDEAHRSSVTCTVTNAAAASGGTRSLRGVGSSTPQVDVETDECGSLLLRDGVTGDNVGDIAEELDSADRYVFTVGEGSYALRGVLGTVGIATEMHDFRRSP